MSFDPPSEARATIADNPQRPWTQPAGTSTALVRFRLTPKSSRDRIGKLIETADGPAIAAHVRAVPENGAANRALIALAAKWLGVPKSTIELTAGAKSRIKSLKLNQTDADVIARLRDHCEDDG